MQKRSKLPTRRPSKNKGNRALSTWISENERRKLRRRQGERRIKLKMKGKKRSERKGRLKAGNSSALR